MRRKNDQLWKGLLEEVFDDMLRFVFPDADQVLDMPRGFAFMDKEMNDMYPEPDKRSDTKFVDKLVKVFRQDGKEEWVLVHIEVQGHMDRRFSERMFTYYCRIFDRYQRPITAIAIFTGEDGKNMSDRYSYHFLGTHHTYQYNALYVADYNDGDLSDSDNPFALVMLAAKKALLAGKVTELELLRQKLLITKLLYRRGLFPKKKIEGILTFLNNYLLFEDKQINRIFIEQLDQITGNTNSMGIYEQLAEIRVAEAEERKDRLFVESLLNSTDFSPEKIAAITGVSLAFVDQIKDVLSPK